MKIPASFAVLALAAGCAQQPESPPAVTPPPALAVTEVRASSETTYQDYPASIEGAANVEIRPQVSGLLDRILVDEGAYVRQGQPLFKINDAPYRERLNNALAAQNGAAGALADARLEVEKLGPLVENKVISEYQAKAAQTALSIAAANLERAKAEVSTARLNVGYTVIKAPVSGYLGRLLKKQGSLVGPTDTDALAQLSDVHEVHVYFSLAENDFTAFRAQYAGHTLEDKIKHLPPVDLILSSQSAYPTKGKVDMVDGQFDRNTGAITLRATFANAAGLLRSGNTGKVRLALLHANTLLVPAEATVEVQDKVFVYALGDSNKVSRQPIVVVGKSGTNYLITGLKGGQRIVTQGLDHLQEGQVIQPQAAAQPAAPTAQL